VPRTILAPAPEQENHCQQTTAVTVQWLPLIAAKVWLHVVITLLAVARLLAWVARNVAPVTHKRRVVETTAVLHWLLVSVLASRTSETAQTVSHE